MTDKIEVYWGDTQDGERHSVECSDERDAQAFATWLESTDGIIPDSVRVKPPEQRGKHAAESDSLLGVACWPPVDPEYFQADAKDGTVGEEQIGPDGRMP